MHKIGDLQKDDIEILQSSVTGNIIGIIFLIIGVIGVILTVRTMKSTKRIEGQIKKETALVLNKEHFREYMEKCIKKLKSNRRNLLQEKRVSYSLCGDTTSMLNDLKEYKLSCKRRFVTMENAKKMVIC